MASKSKNRIIVRLQSSESTHFTTTTKNKKNQKKLALMRFDPILRKHVMYNEVKGKFK